MSDPWGKQSGQPGPWSAGTGHDAVEAILGSLGGGQGGAAGLDALVGQLRQAGLGPQLDSWIGTGSNAPVDPDDMRRAFGDGQLQAIGSRMGLGGGALAALLAQLLPSLIDRFSPQGRMPRDDAEMQQHGGLGGILGGLLSGGLGGLLGGLFGGGQPQQQPGGPGEEVAPPPEPDYRQAKAGWPQQQGGYPGKPGWPDQGGAPSGKPGWSQQEQPAPGPSGGSDDPLGDLSRSADRLGRR